MSFVTPIESESEDDSRGQVVTASATEPGTGASPDSPAELGLHGTGLQGSDERYRTLILGEWEDDYRGKRHLTVRDDGTGTMVVEPDGIGKRLFADRLTFDLVWSLADGRITMKMLRGEPKSKVQLILKLHGQEAEYKINGFGDDQMLLLDPDGKTQYDWRRPAPSPTGR